jgi:hypothetical protein
VRSFLDPLRVKFYGKYFAHYLKIDVGRGADTLKYLSLFDGFDFLNVLSLVDLDGLAM